MNLNATLIGQLIAFALFVWFCMKFVWPPIINAIETRQSQIANALASAEAAKKEQADTKNLVEQELLSAKVQAQEILDAANKRRNEVLDEVKAEAEELKAKIIAQFIFELIFISLPSILASLFLGNVILNQIIGGFINSDNSTININNLLKNDNLISNITIFLQSYGVLIGIIVLSVIIASAMILVKKPKEILSKIS